MIINRFALQRVEVQNSLFFMEAFEIMEMDMEFLRKLPTPKELKEQFPVSEKIAAIKADRDRQIREIFEGKDGRLDVYKRQLQKSGKIPAPWSR